MALDYDLMSEKKIQRDSCKTVFDCGEGIDTSMNVVQIFDEAQQ
jgi:hypothetical protein